MSNPSADAKRVLDAVSASNATLVASFATHHHWDHVGGIVACKEKVESMEIIGGDERIEQLTKLVVDGRYRIGKKLEYQVLQTPCHTTGYVQLFNQLP